jgi:alpha-N-arabinofuranosidase
MRAEYYADVYRRYQTYCRTYGKHKPYRIASGSSGTDYHWTEVLMREAGNLMDGLSVHYYTLCGDTWEKKGSATEFTPEEYYKTLVRAERIDEIIAHHDAIMTRYDPEKRVGLIVDEWGTWFDVEPGTNPGFLYQQNTMRDALVAAVSLNIFNRHCDRVAMANIAQTVNVLQAVLLTEGDRMVLTPTYHVFDLYRAHQDGREVDCFTLTGRTGTEQWAPERVSASASEKNGVYTVTAANLDAEWPEEILLTGVPAGRARARVLSGEIHTRNDFESSPAVIRELEVRTEATGDLTLTLPACAVAEITVG